jgi:hypothetical protein
MTGDETYTRALRGVVVWVTNEKYFQSIARRDKGEGFVVS